ncbi:MAG: hypothetical protein QW641_02965 [Candidatus Aenigmatarchaeota archaeon]
MNIVVAHSDSDGVVSTSLYFKKFSFLNTLCYFSSASMLKSTLCKIIATQDELDKLFIFDIAPTDLNVRLSSIFREVIWIDHHENKLNIEIPSNVTIFGNINYKSASRAVADYFEIKSEILDFIDEIDTNDIKSEEAKFLRDLVSSIKIKYSTNSSKRLHFLSKLLAFYTIKDLMEREEYVKLVENYRKFIDSNIEKVLGTKKIFNIKGRNVLFVETTFQMPIYEIYNRVKNEADLFIGIIRRVNIRKGIVSTKIEMRSESINVFSLAKNFGGGGHSRAAGVTVNKFVSLEELIREIEKIL